MISASRRTDVPAFYMDWFMSGLDAGRFHVENPFSGKLYMVPADPGSVHGIVFWSKDYGPFLAGGYARELQRRGYGLGFQFTVNPEDRLLEPRVPPLAGRLSQMAELCRVVPPGAVTWRFDPVCHFVRDGTVGTNLDGLARIADAAAEAGITRCTTSFLDLYKKVLRRAARVPGFSFTDPSTEQKAEILRRMAASLAKRGIALAACCEREVVELLPDDAGVEQGACVFHPLLEKLYGPGLSHRRDKGQRVAAGCGCHESRDVGSYRHQPCLHDCLFCYANPGR
ncbi:MAG: DUF1848 family protein [Desulfatibacillaceae bacterium]